MFKFSLFFLRTHKRGELCREIVLKF